MLFEINVSRIIQRDIMPHNRHIGVGGSSYLNFSKVPTKLGELCDSVNLRRKQLAINDIVGAYKLSFDAHFQLVTIHPWADGNGRMSRLFMNQLQFEFGVIPVKIDKHSKARYIEALIETRAREDIELFRNFMFDEHIVNLDQMIESYTKSIEQTDVPVNLTKRQTDILEQMRLDPSITATELAVKFGVSDKTIKRDISSLKSEGYITRVGSDKRGEWQIVTSDF